MLKNSRAPGEDEIVSKCLKKGGPCLMNQLHKVISIIWEKEEISDSWRISVLCPVFLKRDISWSAEIIIGESPYSTQLIRFSLIYFWSESIHIILKK